MGDEKVKQDFRKFQEWCRGKSSLYTRFCGFVHEDSELQEAVGSLDGDRISYLLFAAIHYLLMEEPGHRLADFYPSISEDPESPNKEELEGVFQDFLLGNIEQIRQIVAEREVQTNEVRRCTALLPGFSFIGDRTDEKVSIVEIGSSAGLNLYWDCYSYDYGSYGSIDSGEEPLLEGKVKEGDPPLSANVEVEERIGIDLNPLDVNEEEDVRWLKALTWPEHERRRKRLSKAVETAKNKSPEILEGDAVEKLPEAVDKMSDPVIIYSTQTIWEMSSAKIDELLKTVQDLQEEREIYCLFGERGGLDWLRTDRDIGDEGPEVRLEFSDDISGGITDLGCYEVHGKWLKWRF